MSNRSLILYWIGDRKSKIHTSCDHMHTFVFWLFPFALFLQFSTPQSTPRPPEVSSFLSFPSPDKLLKLGPTRALLIEQQVAKKSPVTLKHTCNPMQRSSSSLVCKHFFFRAQVDVSDATKTAEAFLKIASVYKEDNTEVKNAVLDSIGKTLCGVESSCKCQTCVTFVYFSYFVLSCLILSFFFFFSHITLSISIVFSFSAIAEA